MRTLIVPMAGMSSRYPNLRPKWMLTHPWSGRFMGIEAVMGLDLDAFDSVAFVCLREHEERHRFSEGFGRELAACGLGSKGQVILLDRPTASQSETVCRAVEVLGVAGPIFVKDSDNFYRCGPGRAANQVAYFDLAAAGCINAGSKSYVQFDSNGILTNIVEKKIVSPFFSVGGYGFESASDFVDVFRGLAASNPSGEIYISHVIFEMILSGVTFSASPVSDYKDWGTLDDWRSYTRQYRCMFVDIDGVLLENTSDHFSDLGTGRLLERNVARVAGLHREGKTYVVLTTSRREEFREMTERELESKGVPYDLLVMGLPHCQRVVVNDFAPSNPHPSCSAVNLRRDADDLGEYI